MNARDAAEKIVPHVTVGIGTNPDQQWVMDAIAASESSRAKNVVAATKLVQQAIDCARAEDATFVGKSFGVATEGKLDALPKVVQFVENLVLSLNQQVSDAAEKSAKDAKVIEGLRARLDEWEEYFGCTSPHDSFANWGTSNPFINQLGAEQRRANFAENKMEAMQAEIAELRSKLKTFSLNKPLAEIDGRLQVDDGAVYLLIKGERMLLSWDIPEGLSSDSDDRNVRITIHERRE